MKSLECGRVRLPPKTSEIIPLNLKLTSNWQLATRAQLTTRHDLHRSLSYHRTIVHPSTSTHPAKIPYHRGYRPGLLIASIKQCIASVLLATTVSTQQTLSSTWLEEKRITLRMQGRRYPRQSNTKNWSSTLFDHLDPINCR